MAEIGQILAGRYRITGVLDTGDGATIYHAEDTHLPGRIVALKAMSLAGLPADAQPVAREQFATQAQLFARLNHPGLAVVTDFFDDAEHGYLVMERVPGQSLASFLQTSG